MGHQRKTRRGWLILLAMLVNIGLMGTLAISRQTPAQAYDVCPAVGHACVHEYFAARAVEILPPGPVKDAILANWANIEEGVGDEDNFDHVYGLNLDVPLIGKPIVTATHFWDADVGPEAEATNADSYALGDYANSWQKMRALWLLALGAYANGDTVSAYHYLGHIVHHLEDNTVPAHVHDDAHPNLFPDITGGLDDDSFHVWMDDAADGAETPKNAKLTSDEMAMLASQGPLPMPAGSISDRLFWLLESTNQIADHFASDDYDGDDNGLTPALLAGTGWSLPLPGPTSTAELENNDGCSIPVLPLCPGYNNDSDGDLMSIRVFSYLRGIRAVAALYQLWEEATRQNTHVAVQVIRVVEDGDGEELDQECFDPPVGPEVCTPDDDPEFFAKVLINGWYSSNRGNFVDGDDDISPAGWVWAKEVGLTGTASIQLGIWDHDGKYLSVPPFTSNDEQSDISVDGDKTLDITVDIAKCLSGAPDAVTAAGFETGIACGQEGSQKGNNDEEESTIYFKVFMTNAPPTANAGGPYTTNEGSNIELNGTGSTDPDGTGDITTYAWDLDGDGDCDDVANDPTPDFIAVGQDGVFTVKLCVTDAAGFTDDDTATVTVNNLAPSLGVTAATPVSENTPTTVSGTISDPGWLEALTATVDWGDGAGVQSLPGTLENNRPNATLTYAAFHTYGDNGTFTVKVCGTDDDTTTCGETSVQVTNANPTAVIDLSGAVNVNGTPTLIINAGAQLGMEGRSTDPGSDDLTLRWDWGDGTAATSTAYLVNPPSADPPVSPSIQPRNVVDVKAHAYAKACTYTIGYSAADDDAGSASMTANVIIVGNGKNQAGDGYWRQQFRTHLTGKGKTDFDAETLGCYLRIVSYMSKVFDESRLAATFAKAESILDPSGPKTQRGQLDKNLLTAWLNFADGRIKHDELFDLDGNGTRETTFLAALAAAEAVRLNPASTEAALKHQTNLLGTLH